MMDRRTSNSFFEQEVLTQLGDIKALCATNAAENKAVCDRVTNVEHKFETQENRQWIKAMLMSVVVLVAHPLIRKMGWDV